MNDADKTATACVYIINTSKFPCDLHYHAVHVTYNQWSYDLVMCMCRKDKGLESQVREKLAGVDTKLEQMIRQERSLENNITTKSERKKLAIF